MNKVSCISLNMMTETGIHSKKLSVWGTIGGPSGDLLGTIWGPSGTSGDHLGPLGTIWGPLGTIWGPLGTIWEIDSMKLSISLRNRTFRSARIDLSSLPKH